MSILKIYLNNMKNKSNKGCPHGCGICDDWSCNSYEYCNYEYELDKDDDD